MGGWNGWFPKPKIAFFGSLAYPTLLGIEKPLLAGACSSDLFAEWPSWLLAKLVLRKWIRHLETTLNRYEGRNIFIRLQFSLKFIWSNNLWLPTSKPVLKHHLEQTHFLKARVSFREEWYISFCLFSLCYKTSQECKIALKSPFSVNFLFMMNLGVAHGVSHVIRQMDIGSVLKLV